MWRTRREDLLQKFHPLDGRKSKKKWATKELRLGELLCWWDARYLREQKSVAQKS